ncbi:MAG: 23S rRNA (adenine(2503)-C(2))-methyltransferase RlmN [Christensenellales bacterium]
MKILADYDLKELADIFSGEKRYLAGQILSFCHNGKSIDEMTSLSKEFREKLKTEYVSIGIEILKEFKGKDGTSKFLLKLSDDQLIESVFMTNNYGNTVCVSTQVGCRMGCKFCASGKDGLLRNLSSGEILGQILVINRYFGGTAKDRKIANVVLMGSGEPLDNYENVIKFLSLLNIESGINISERNVSLSTCGLCDKVYSLADSGHHPTLTFSLHAPNDGIRCEIMPIAKKYSVKDIVKSAKYYFEKTGRRIIFEYSLINGVNDKVEHAKELAALIKGFPSHVNLIRLNKIDNGSLLPSMSANEFKSELEKLGVSATIRRSLGSDIEGACGQLKRRYLCRDEL